MIKYNLVCKKCDLIFDSWFASSLEFDKLKKKELINCHRCGSLRVEKGLMAPKLINKTFRNSGDIELLSNLLLITKIHFFRKKSDKQVKGPFVIR